MTRYFVPGEHLKTEIHKLDINWCDRVNAQVNLSLRAIIMRHKKGKVYQRSTRPGCVLQMNFINSQEIVVVSDLAQ
jgi:hypothetical protein